MFCSNCGQEFKTDAKFCQNCGHQVGQGSPEVATEEKQSPKSATKKLSWKQKWQRKPKWQKIAGVIGLIIGLSWAFGDAFKGINMADEWFGGVDDPVAFVQQSYLDGYPDQTVGEAVNEFFGDEEWTYVDMLHEPDKAIVQVEGTLRYNNQLVYTVLQ